MENKNQQINKLLENKYHLEENLKTLEIKVVDLEEKNQILQQNLNFKSNENSRIKSKLVEVFLIL